MPELDLGKISMRIGADNSEFKKKMREIDGEAKKTAEGIGGFFGKSGKIGTAFSALGKAVSVTRDFRKEISSISSIALDLDTRKAEQAILSLDSRFGDSAQIANAMLFAYASGVRGSEKELAGFSGEIARLNQAIRGELTPTMSAVTSLMTAYNLSVKDAGNVSDWFYQIAASGKVSGTELASSLGMAVSAAAEGGVALDELGASIAALTVTMPAAQAADGLNQAILSFINPARQAKETAAKYGIELSAAALKTKGWKAALEEIHGKIGENASDLAKIFSSSEALKTVLALTSAQYGMFNNILDEFHGKAGNAQKGFEAFLEFSGEDKIGGMLSALSKFLIQFERIAGGVVTLNGALEPLYQKIAAVSAGFLRWAAAAASIAAEFAGIGKAANAVQACGAEILERGGFQSNAEIEKQQIAARENLRRAEEAKSAASSKRQTAVQEALAKRRIFMNQQEILSLKAKELAAAKANLRTQEIREAGRYQNWLNTGSGEYQPDSRLGSAQNAAQNAQTNNKGGIRAVRHFQHSTTGCCAPVK